MPHGRHLLRRGLLDAQGVYGWDLWRGWGCEVSNKPVSEMSVEEVARFVIDRWGVHGWGESGAIDGTAEAIALLTAWRGDREQVLVPSDIGAFVLVVVSSKESISPVSLVSIGRTFGLTEVQTRGAMQQLIEDGRLVLDDQMHVRCARPSEIALTKDIDELFWVDKSPESVAQVGCTWICDARLMPLVNAAIEHDREERGDRERVELEALQRLTDEQHPNCYVAIQARIREIKAALTRKDGAQ